MSEATTSNQKPKGTESAGLLDKPGLATTLMIILVLLLCAANLLVFCEYGSSSAGDFGAAFGVASAIFSGLAFAGLIGTLLYQRAALQTQRRELRLQRNELKLQRLELEQTREVAKQQAQELANQAAAMREQRFESHFYSMLKMHEELRSTIKYEDWTGRESVKRIASHLKNAMGPVNAHFGQVASPLATGISSSHEASELGGHPSLEVLEKRYRLIYMHGLGDMLGHLMRMTYVILREVDDAPTSEKKRYARILRSTLSQGELTIMLYNGLVFSKAKALYERYDMFNNLSSAYLGHPDHRNLYNSAKNADTFG